jgi:predicted DNA-binding protein (MmcQ/YjbR family)
MELQELLDFCLSKPDSYVDLPFGDSPICIKVSNRIFAQLFPDDDKITLKCNPYLAEIYRENFPEIVLPGYHFPNKQKKYWNTILQSSKFEKTFLKDMINHSYDEVTNKIKGK